MDPRLSGRLTGAVFLLAMGACATVRPEPGGPVDGPLPPGTYELSSEISYRADSETMRHDTHASFSARLYVSIDGTTEMYSGQNQCVDPRDIPGHRERRNWAGGNPGHHFSCGNASWTLWADQKGELLGRLTTGVTEMVASQKKCLSWSYDTGRAQCDEYGVEVRPRSRTVRAAVTVKRVGG